MIEDEAQYSQVDKEGDTSGVSRRDCFNRTAARRENKKPLASQPKNVSNELTDHIPTHRSETRNHIQTHNSQWNTVGERCGNARVKGRRPC